MLSSSRPQQTRTTRRTRLAGGAAMHLSSHAGHPRSATSDKTQGSQALARPTASKRVSSPPIGSLSLASDVTDDEHRNSKPRSIKSSGTATGVGEPREQADDGLP